LDKAVLEIVKLSEFLSQNEIPLSVGLRFMRNLLERNISLLSELKVMNFAEHFFKKQFIKLSETPDLISENSEILIEVKSLGNNYTVKELLNLYWKTQDTSPKNLTQLGKLILYQERGKKVFIAVHNRRTDEITLHNFTNILSLLPKNSIEKAKKLAVSRRKGRPPMKLPIKEILQKLNQGWTKKAVWRWLVTDRSIKISYDHFLRRLNKYMEDKKLSEKRVIIKEAKRSCVKV